MHFIINNHPSLFKIDGINSFIITIFFITVKVFSLSTMSTEMEKQIIVWLSTLDKPVHGTEDICSGWMSCGILLIVCENNHIVPPKVISRIHELRHISD